MTCIVAVTDGKRVVIGGDSAAVAGYNIRHAVEPKVAKVAGLVLGYTSSFRMGQLLARRLKEPIGGWIDIVDQLPDECRKIFGDAGFKEVKNGVDHGGTFLVGWKGRIFRVCDDFQMTEHPQFDACGCGEDFALGWLVASYKKGCDLRMIARGALKASERLCGGVRGPFNFVEIGA